ncbi:transposable element Tcb1 transposase [Trichonephila clavipes]|uniref:Transposable element Tcb1 transposase n=1 Tax=Trichonephila clavipes TaxID=2585209 RepID=A0A8X6S443_TRICX|nr:transposable element Tcb1 transposase [Trichonephila clavipes]
MRDRYLAATAKRNRQSTESGLSRQLSSATDTTVSRQTVYRRLGHIGLYARRPVRCVPLTATHCLVCSLILAGLSYGELQVLVITKRTPLNDTVTVVQDSSFGEELFLVPELTCMFRGNNGSHTNRDVILEQHVRLYRDAMGAEFLLLDDNVRPHRANIVDEFLQSEDITHMDWSAYSPDLNPIEHVWDMLGRRIAARQPPPTCLPELWRALLDEWCNIPQDQIDNLILSMRRRCKAYIASSGRHTLY